MKRIAIAIIASGVVAASAVHANPYDQTVVVPRPIFQNWRAKAAMQCFCTRGPARDL
jgi:hypothetical protein